MNRLAHLEETGQAQYAEVDPDARLLSRSGQNVAGYNVQIATINRHHLIVHAEVTSEGNGTQQWVPMAQAGNLPMGA